MSHYFNPHDRAMTEAAQRHARESFPDEACGGVTARGYVPFRNHHPTPEKAFDCMLDAEPLQISGELLALVHSHPGGPEGPSEGDIAQQVAMGIPWGITICTDRASRAPYFWGDVIEVPPFEERGFRHGPSGSDGKGDCYALIKDWYLAKLGIRLPEPPRADGWWRNGGDLYRDNYAANGFYSVNGRDSVVGDVWLMQILSRVPNHGAIYLGEGLILHHLPERFSRIEPAIGWQRHVCERLRHVGP